MTSDAIRLSAVTLNAPDALALARFYAEITGGRVQGRAEWARVSGPGGDIEFQQVADLRPPTWPEGDTPMHIHLDFHVEDLAATEARVLAAGATRFDTQPNADHCLVYADPAGHPFCLSLWDWPQIVERLAVQADAPHPSA
ncbi:VOC family protein [Cellulomonas sp. zg-ZUI222]|uniref:VOC family protein n=1 Tax=Cellulomonas wangleii TaxID=2816956 RepID=UPI001A93BB7C|nr:VOC family protein [Cellulomonas wangleii]MBO0919563.1 VOC family protein [Cellulomonas wangleii]